MASPYHVGFTPTIHQKPNRRYHNEIIAWYDGYSWDGRTRVINPFSLLRFFQSKKFYSFWFASGSPTFLLKLIKDKPSSFHSLGNLKVSELAFDACEIKRISPESLMFQTGYLTVQEVLQQIGPPLYMLDIPNLEVREALNLHVLAEFTENDIINAQSAYNIIKGSLETGDLQGVLVTMRALFASIPYKLHVSAEAYYHSIFVAMMKLLGFDIKAEVAVSGGSIDAVLELDDKVYIVEFKYKGCDLDATPEMRQKLFDKALKDGVKQIKDRGYSRKYDSSGKTIYHAAFAFLGRDNVEMLVEP